MKNTIFSVFFVVIATLFLISCSGGTGNIQGEIKLNLIEHIEGKDLGGTTVKIKGRNETAATDKDGKFTLKNVDAGTYTVAISHIGWDSKDVEVKVSAGKVNTLDETLDYSLGILKGGVSYADYEEYELYDETQFRLAKITLTKEKDETIIEIGETGTFSKVDLAEGEYSAVITADGYENEELSLNIEKNKVLTVAAVKLKFQKGGIKGEVVDTSNNLHEGFSVKVFRKDDSLAVEEFLTEADGVFQFDFITSGSYQIQIEKENYLTVTKDVEVEAKKVVDAGEFELVAIDSSTLNTTINEKDAPVKNTNKTDAEFYFKANFEGSVFECSLDSTDGWESCTSPKKYEGLGDGEHLFKVRAVLGDIVEETPALYSWTVDTVPPVITIYEYPILKTTLKSGQISFTVDSTTEQLLCTLDAEKVPCSTSTAEFTDIEAGEHVFTVKAIDEAQNEGTTTFEWNVVDNQGWYSVETIYSSEAICAIALDGTLSCKYGDEAFSEIEGLWREVSLFSFEYDETITKTVCGIQFDSTLWCWGTNKGGQLGNGTETDSAEPVQIEGLWKNVVVRGIEDVNYSFFISVCAINYDDELYCWGQTNTTVKNKNPLKILNLPAKITGFHRSYYFDDNFVDLLLIGDNGKIYPMERMTVSPDSVDLDDFVILSNRFDSQSHMCGINLSGELMCWGNDSEGETGSGDISGLWKDVVTHEHIPYYFDQMSFAEVPLSAGLSKDGYLYLWGHGFGEEPFKINNEKYQVLEISGKSNADIYLINESDELKKLTLSGMAESPQLIELGFSTAAGLISCGRSSSSNFTLFLGEANGIYSFGQNGSSGNLGNNESQTTKLIPSNIGGAWSVFSAGALGGCGIKTDGSLNCWGKELSFAAQPYPVKIGTDSDWFQVATGSSHSCALKNDGSLYCIGSNGSGQIGNGTNTTAVQMTEITTPAIWKSISTFSRHTCGIDSNDELYCWGENESGQLGDGSQTDRNAPFKTGGSDKWKDVSAGLNHTCAIKNEDSTLWCTGNYAGTVKTSLTQVGTALWSRVSSGAGFTCLINSSEKIYCFGKNDAYQLGNGTTNDSDVPVQIAFNATLWKEVSAGYNHACGIRVGGNIMCWGIHPGFIDLKTVTY
jgi:alpha-tubulin suppressor-like RCC1 family protein